MTTREHAGRLIYVASAKDAKRRTGAQLPDVADTGGVDGGVTQRADGVGPP